MSLLRSQLIRLAYARPELQGSLLPVLGSVSKQAGEMWYHLTNRAKFKLDPKFAPQDNSIAIEDRSGRPGIYMARNIEPWVNGHNYARPFVVEFEVDPSVKEDPGVHGRWGGEMFIPASSFEKLQVKRVIPLDAWCREHFGDYGWVEEDLGFEFDTGDVIPPLGRGIPRKSFRGYRYTGPDVRQMSSTETNRLKQDLKKSGR